MVNQLPKLREADVLRTVRDYLKVHRIFHFRMNVGAMKFDKRFVYFGTIGAPDIFAVHHGRVFALECKSPTGFMQRSQIAFEQEFEKAGGIYVIVRSVEDVDLALRAGF